MAALSGGASSALAGPILNLDLHHGQTNFAPGSAGEYWFDVSNVGDQPTSGTVTLKVTLPSGFTAKGVRFVHTSVRSDIAQAISWSCPAVSGSTVVTCTTNSPIPRHFSMGPWFWK